MRNQKQDAIDWWNSLTRNKRDELALDYYATPLIIDDEIVHIYLSEVAQEKTFKREEIQQLFEKLTVRGVFKTDRDYEVAKQTLLELTGIDYEQEIK